MKLIVDLRAKIVDGDIEGKELHWIEAFDAQHGTGEDGIRHYTQVDLHIVDGAAVFRIRPGKGNITNVDREEGAREIKGSVSWLIPPPNKENSMEIILKVPIDIDILQTNEGFEVAENGKETVHFKEPYDAYHHVFEQLNRLEGISIGKASVIAEHLLNEAQGG